MGVFVDANPCAGVGMFFALFWGVVCSFLSCFGFRAGFRAGSRVGFRAACDEFQKIITAAECVDVFGPAVERLLGLTNDEETKQ